jgi:hypothetical protein
MTSSTPELEVEAGGARARAGDAVEVPGAGDLRVRTWGHPPGAALELQIGGRVVELEAGPDGAAAWRGPRLLDGAAGTVRVAVAGREVLLRVRPGKLSADALAALVDALEAVAEGLAQDAGGLGQLGERRSHEGELAALDQAVGLASSAAAAIRRRPVHRPRERAQAIARAGGARTAADARWLATHPVAAIRAAATGRDVGLRRDREADLDTLENRGVLATYDQLDRALARVRGLVAGELDRLQRARPAREAFLTERSNLWAERDQPRADALERRLARLDALAAEAAATRARAGLPDLRPRGARMVRTPRVDAEPGYWATFRAAELAAAAEAARAAPVPAVVGSLDELWEQWCTVTVAQALRAALGPPVGALVDPGWFAQLRRGEVARWTAPRRAVRLLYEPEIAHGAGDLRKLHPGRPWRPDLVIELRWADGTVDLHVLDAKFRVGDGGGPPMEALHELWWRYGEGIGDAQGRPLVRSLWVLWPGRGLRPVAPGMLRDGWPAERLRGGAIGLWPGEAPEGLERALRGVMGG